MNKNAAILDCTLRDGGFINNWRFGKVCIADILSNLSLSKVDIIEIGYLREDAKKSIHTTEYSKISQIDEIINNLNIKSKLVAIIDYGKFHIDLVDDSINSSLFGLRVTFKKQEIDDALIYCENLMKKGYKVFVQPVSLTDYSDAEILNLVTKVNKINPFSMAIVDTYGFMFKEDILHYLEMIDQNLNEKIALGYHGHNNFQLASSNAMFVIEKSLKRMVIVDSSMYGMGKGAGNAHTELLMNYCNKFQNSQYKIKNILEMIDSYIKPIKERKKWGYDLNYFINGLLEIHPSYVSYLLNKKTLVIESIIEILKKVNSKNKTKFDKLNVDPIYENYIKENILNRKINYALLPKNDLYLVVGPGPSFKKEIKNIKDFLLEKNCKVISTNFIPESIDIDYLLITNNKRLGQLEKHLHNKKNRSFKIIFTSDLDSSKIIPDLTIESLNIDLDENGIFQNSLITVLTFLEQSSLDSVY